MSGGIVIGGIVIGGIVIGWLEGRSLYVDYAYQFNRCLEFCSITMRSSIAACRRPPIHPCLAILTADGLEGRKERCAGR